MLKTNLSSTENTYIKPHVLNKYIFHSRTLLTCTYFNHILLFKCIHIYCRFFNFYTNTYLKIQCRPPLTFFYRRCYTNRHADILRAHTDTWCKVLRQVRRQSATQSKVHETIIDIHSRFHIDNQQMELVSKGWVKTAVFIEMQSR